MLVRFADTDCDVSKDIAKKWGYKLISMPYVVDGNEIYPYEDWEEFDSKAFYQSLREGVMPSTCGISPEKYRQYFEPEFAAGNDILYVHFSAKMSSTFNAMRLALDSLLEKYPDRKFYALDCKAITGFALFLLEDIAKYMDEGHSIEEIIAYGEKERDKAGAYFFADDLKFFAKSGRVSGLSALFGGLLGIKPIISINDEGEMKAVDKVKGKPNAIKYLLSKVEELGDEPEKRGFYILHTDAEELANHLASLLREKYGENTAITISPVNPTAGAHCGPNCVGVAFRAKHR